MRIYLQSETETIRLAGEPETSEREFSSAFDFRMSGATDVQVSRKVRGSHARPIDRGNLSRSISFGSARNFPTAQAAQDFATAYERNYPRSGEVIFQTADGARKLTEAVVYPPSVKLYGTNAVFFYQVDGREMEPHSDAPPEPEFLIDEVEALLHRVVEHNDEKWFEVGFLSPYNNLLGDAANGWTDPGGYLFFRLERSENLTTWDHAWIDAPGSPVNNGDDTFTYWARSTFPVDSKVKSGLIEVSSGAAYGVPIQTPGNIHPDTRNNPFTALTVLGVSRALGGFPYTMPGDASRMQTDLAALFTGATVEAIDATNWRIRIPNVSFTNYQQVNKVFWPQYLVADMFGVVNVPVNGADFQGVFFNSANVRTGLNKQFGRAKVTPGPNHLYTYD
jgi:hypothetical protein